MAQNVSNSSTQNTIMFNLSSSYSGTITLGDITYTPKKSYTSVLISSETLSLNNTYTLKIDDKEIESTTITSTVTTVGNSSMGGMMGGQGGTMQAPNNNRQQRR